MKKIGFFFCILALLVSCNSPSNSSDKGTHENWQLGVQAYTFREFSFFEAIDKSKALGLHYIEAYPGQKIGGELDGVIDYNLDSETSEKIKDYLKTNDIEWKAFGVIVPETREAWDSLFVFARDMGISNIVSEPKPEDLSYLSKLTEQYKINIAIHNHPQPSPYWHPDSILTKIDGLSTRIGACADFGHFSRSGLDPLESVKKLKGHIIEAHIKDVSNDSPKAIDTIWGTGTIPLPQLLAELKDQDFKGLLSIEYEADPEDNISQLKKSIAFYNKQLKTLSKKSE